VKVAKPLERKGRFNLAYSACLLSFLDLASLRAIGAGTAKPGWVRLQERRFDVPSRRALNNARLTYQPQSLKMVM